MQKAKLNPPSKLHLYFLMLKFWPKMGALFSVGDCCNLNSWHFLSTTFLLQFPWNVLFVDPLQLRVTFHKSFECISLFFLHRKMLWLKFPTTEQPQHWSAMSWSSRCKTWRIERETNLFGPPEATRCNQNPSGKTEKRVSSQVFRRNNMMLQCLRSTDTISEIISWSAVHRRFREFHRTWTAFPATQQSTKRKCAIANDKDAAKGG